MSEMVIASGWQPGALGWIVAEHGRYYHAAWGLGAGFEATVAKALGSWMERYDPACDRLLLVRSDEGFLATLGIDGSGVHVTEMGARLRFFIVSDRTRGTGIGRRLLQAGMDFIHESGFRRAHLTTFAGLDAARALYESHGFVLQHEAADETWGRPLVEQTFVWSAP